MGRFLIHTLFALPFQAKVILPNQSYRTASETSALLPKFPSMPPRRGVSSKGHHSRRLPLIGQYYSWLTSILSPLKHISQLPHARSCGFIALAASTFPKWNREGNHTGVVLRNSGISCNTEQPYFHIGITRKELFPGGKEGSYVKLVLYPSKTDMDCKS